jgi:hypothetical protein
MRHIATSLTLQQQALAQNTADREERGMEIDERGSGMKVWVKRGKR